MEENILSPEANYSKKTHKKNWIAPIIAIVLVIVAAISIPSIINLNKRKQENIYTVNYMSISDQGEFFNVYFNISTRKSFVVYSSDFSVQINGIPIKADRLYKESDLLSTSMYISRSGTIIIQFRHRLNSIDRPIRFFYRGKELINGSAIEFNHMN